MRDLLFNTPEKKAVAKDAFSGLVVHPGWKLLVQIWEENIRLLQEQLESGIEGETKEDIDRLRDKLAIFRQNITTPIDIVKGFEENEANDPILDPFYRKEDLVKKRT